MDLFEALSSGKMVHINTAKDLLKEAGSRGLGRFFIAMLGQAVLERFAIPTADRRPCFVYVDEAHEYFDEQTDCGGSDRDDLGRARVRECAEVSLGRLRSGARRLTRRASPQFRQMTYR